MSSGRFLARGTDRKSTRLNSSHSSISYAVFCLKKKKPGIGARDNEERQMRNLTVNGERLWASLIELAQIGATEKGGFCRIAASALDSYTLSLHDALPILARG